MVIDKKMILVIGATGNQGGKLINQLMLSGTYTVRGMTRDLNTEKVKNLINTGVDMVEGTMDDVDSLKAAFNGVYGVFFVAIGPESIEQEVTRGTNVVDTAKYAGVKHIVFSGVSGGNRKIGVPRFETKGAIESIIKESNIPYTIIRPVSFMDNFNREMDKIKSGRLSGILSPQKKQWFIAVQNIAEFAYASFDRPEEFIGKEIDLAGDVMNLTEVAEIFSTVLKTDIKYKYIEENDRERVPEYIKTMTKFYEAEGYSVDVQELKNEWDIPLTSLRDWIISEPGWVTD
jgi:uncharacterized protein YbjT (DUF2867 family)